MESIRPGPFFSFLHCISPKIRGKPPKWMVYNGSKPLEQMDDLGVKTTIFGSTPKYFCWGFYHVTH